MVEPFISLENKKDWQMKAMKTAKKTNMPYTIASKRLKIYNSQEKRI
jgi:hypothetical protein